MKKVIFGLLSFISVNAFAYEATLTEKQTVSIEDLVQGGVTQVTCENPEPRCVFQGIKYGVQYPGQSLKDVVWTNAFSNEEAADKITEIKSKGLCK